jgi:hypothetical protein
MRAPTKGSSPAPARIARNIQHGRKCHGQAIIGGLGSRRARGHGPHGLIEYGCFTERNGEQGVVPMQNVQADQQGDAEPRLLHCQGLHLVHVLVTDHVEQIADGAAFNPRG